ncbi:hypothetical protein A1O1_02582 [Capronia coronata CBS 617.96]|uniref:Uncharacterized protein n=1 Tax=Capronia coronata CBS 617.96 TaxID=1182541 RepID=W9ZI52_9EURO|nr:uncharacterized protein A1O1_02582 [Capronia coronata CBS 617.96]EXJ94189.1 hypothetical protein A1O1_02582 [Capronia coronata CBS 617.96]
MSATPAVSDVAGPNDAATKLAEAIDDFLGDLEKKFKGISDEILTKREFGSRGLLRGHCLGTRLPWGTLLMR